jgi:hypothetical protein
MTHAEVAKRIEKAIVSWLASPMASIGSGARRPLLFPKVFPANYYKKRADERTRTADLLQLRERIGGFRGVDGCFKTL